MDHKECVAKLKSKKKDNELGNKYKGFSLANQEILYIGSRNFRNGICLIYNKKLDPDFIKRVLDHLTKLN